MIHINRDYAEGTHEQAVAARTPAESDARLRRLYPQYDALILTDDDTAETYQARLAAECDRRMAAEKLRTITRILNATRNKRHEPHDEYYLEVGIFFR